jgi:hypothetical protein
MRIAASGRSGTHEVRTERTTAREKRRERRGRCERGLSFHAVAKGRRGKGNMLVMFCDECQKLLDVVSGPCCRESPALCCRLLIDNKLERSLAAVQGSPHELVNLGDA